MSDLLDSLNEAALFAINNALDFDGTPLEAGMRDLGFNYGHLHRKAYDELERLRHALLLERGKVEAADADNQRLRDELEELRRENDRLRQERSDALNVNGPILRARRFLAATPSPSAPAEDKT